MPFPNILASVTGEPRFIRFPHRDVNPVSGTKKWRILSKPNPPMRKVHDRFCEAIQYDACELTAQRDSTFANAAEHLENRFFYQTDLAHAYKSVLLIPMVRALRECHPDWPEGELTAFLRKYCFEHGGRGLIMGAPSSPDLFRIYATSYLDRPLFNLWMPIETGGWIGRAYTRYCDDLTFSSPQPIASAMRRRIRDIIQGVGFEVNDRKTTLCDLAKGSIMICGVRLEYRGRQGARMLLPRRYLSKVRGMLHLAVAGKAKVDHKVVTGMWGVFCATTFGKHKKTNAEGLIELNRTEERIWKLYRQYENLRREKRR